MADQDGLSLVRVLQLASSTLPVGAYAYSQGLEWAVAAAWIVDESSLKAWLKEHLMTSVAQTDLPIFLRLFDAAIQPNDQAMREWSRVLVASRETSELVSDDCARGRALAKLLAGLGVDSARVWLDRTDTPFAALSALAAAAWDIPRDAAVTAYTWSWLEGQVLAGVRLIPLGQIAGQQLLHDLASRIPQAIADAQNLGDDEIGATLPTLALASSLHETQYTRLYRS